MIDPSGRSFHSKSSFRMVSIFFFKPLESVLGSSEDWKQLQNGTSREAKSNRDTQTRQASDRKNNHREEYYRYHL